VGFLQGSIDMSIAGILKILGFLCFAGGLAIYKFSDSWRKSYIKKGLGTLLILAGLIVYVCSDSWHKSYTEKKCYSNEAMTIHCTSLALIYEEEENYLEAKHLYEKVCFSENEGSEYISLTANGCFGIGWLYYNGYGVKHDDAQAKKYFSMACDRGSQAGCDYYKKLNKTKTE
jgi:hypothetical protein